MTITTKRNARGKVNCYVNGKKTAVAEIAEIAIAERDTRENSILTVINENGEAYDINTWEKWFVYGTRAAKKIAEIIRIHSDVEFYSYNAPAINAEADPADYVISEEALEVAVNAEIEMANAQTPTDKPVLEETDGSEDDAEETFTAIIPAEDNDYDETDEPEILNAAALRMTEPTQTVGKLNYIRPTTVKPTVDELNNPPANETPDRLRDSLARGMKE